MQAIGRALWGIDASVLYDSMSLLSEVREGSTVLDVPCGGGVALRALPPERDVRYIAIDIDEAMLERARDRALRRGLSQVEFVEGDMLALPIEDEQADLVLSYSGLHMVSDTERAVEELARCLKPGGRLIGTTFLAGGNAARGHCSKPAPVGGTHCRQRARILFAG